MAKTVTDSYMALIVKFRLRPIRSEADLDAATKIIHSLVDKPALDAGEEEYLDALSDLVWIYENEHHAIEAPEPPDMLASMIEHRQVSQRAVAAATGIPVSTISELIARKRDFTLSHVRKLSAYFGIAPDVFIDSEKVEARKSEPSAPIASVAKRLGLKLPTKKKAAR